MAFQALELGLWPVGSWALWLDTDDRVELFHFVDLEAWLATWLATPAAIAAGVGLVNVYRPDQEWCPEGLRYPRLLRMAPDLHWEPPRDWDVYAGTDRIAWGGMQARDLPGVAVDVPVTVLRLRHDRAARSPESLARTARYYRRRKAAHGTEVP